MKFEKDERFLSGRMKSMKYALIGAYKLANTEHSVISQISIGVLITIAGFYFEITKTEWLFQTLAIGLVLSIEGLNTAVEKIAEDVLNDILTSW